MTRIPYDDYAKDLLDELLSPGGESKPERKVSGEVRTIDMYFTPDRPRGETHLNTLGLLGEFAKSKSLFEIYRNPVEGDEILSCLSKLLDVMQQQRRQARRSKQRFNREQLAQLWILTPTVSDALLEQIGAKLKQEQWGEGIYWLAPALRSAIVVIHQLPKTPQTLWLRLLGRGRVQEEAIAELETLPHNNANREKALEVLQNLR